MPPPRKHFQQDRIYVSKREKALFNTFMNALAAEGRQDSVLRVVGGWVRDKILRKESQDIDIAIDNMSGVDLSTILNNYFTSKGQATCKVGVVTKNPAKSKHLETACIHLKGYQVDLVNLRAESYQADSRIPSEISFGTPKEDALRRDFTINALFYNINTATIEDYTGMGLKDLKEGIIRTPLDCAITFFDDPLRILRAVRFSKRLGFKIHDDIYRVMQNNEITSRLQIISRQRYTKELDEILSEPNLAIGIKGLHDLNVFKEIFLYILNVSMDEEINTEAVYQKTLGFINKYIGAAHILADMEYLEALDTDINSLSYLISLFSIGLAIEETVLTKKNMPLSSLKDMLEVSIDTKLIEGATKQQASHCMMPIMWYVARICCATPNVIAETLFNAHEYMLSLCLDGASAPERHILFLQKHNNSTICLCLCVLLLSPQYKRVFDTYGLDECNHLLELIRAKPNMHVPDLAEACGVSDPVLYSFLKDAATLCYLRDVVVQKGFQETGELTSQITIEYCCQNLNKIQDILQDLRSQPQISKAYKKKKSK